MLAARADSVVQSIVDEYESLNQLLEGAIEV